MTLDEMQEISKLPVKTYYMWKEMFQSEDGTWYNIDPHSDGMQYEYPISFMYDTIREASEWLRTDAIDDWGVDPKESDDWVLVKYEETIITQGIYP